MREPRHASSNARTARHGPSGGDVVLCSAYDLTVPDDENEPRTSARGLLRRRAAAGCLDLVVVTALTLPVALIAGEAPANLSGAWSAIWLGVAVLYYAIPEWRVGTSLGKR